MNKQEILIAAGNYIKKGFTGETTGHDFYHIERVVKTARKIASEENADLFLVELAAWLHDVGDYKLHDGMDKSEELISEFLFELNLPKETISKIIKIVSQVSFSKGNAPTSLEAKIVQDADRLDALGAIGLARTFAYGGSKQREIYNPEIPEETSIQHFYDKLLKLKDLMNTNSAKKIAEERHQFLEEFLERFYEEWES
ncbi:HD domain-containing protein [Moheibacter sp.]|uniref:HD domain-containing protein n=1 Tax=Moheibacter sp. TaxID=1965316 RepID=UPI003C728D98